jgi:ribonuclease D
VRRRMDRPTEKRLAVLKDWRGPRAEALKLDPGVLCPNSALESIAWANPENAEDMKALPELKCWFVREFASEIIGVLERHSNEGEADDGTKGEAAQDAPAKRSGRRSGRAGSGASAAKANSKTTGSSRSGGQTKSES